MKNHTPALIVARPGRVRDGLQALLTTVPQIGTVDLADDGPSALRMVRRRHPALVLLDINLHDDEVSTLLRQIKARWPQTRCLVLADSVRLQQMARDAGADSVLLKGFPAAQLFATIEGLLK